MADNLLQSAPLQCGFWEFRYRQTGYPPLLDGVDDTHQQEVADNEISTPPENKRHQVSRGPNVIIFLEQLATPCGPGRQN